MIVNHIAARATIYDKTELLEEHAHSIQRVYPTLAAGVTITADAASYLVGVKVEIIPANTLSSDFDIHFLCIAEMSGNDDYELFLYDEDDTFLGSKCFTKSAGGEPSSPLMIQTPVMHKNSQIQAALATEDAQTRTLKLKLEYHLY